MILWLDAVDDGTLKTSSFVDIASTNFGNIGNDDPISVWRDKNPQLSTDIVATIDTRENGPTYASQGINGFPALKFSTGDELIISNSGSDDNDIMNLPNTIFVVAEFTNLNPSTIQYFVGRQYSGNNGSVYLRRNGSSFQYSITDDDGGEETPSTGTPVENVPFILSARGPKEGTSSLAQLAINGADFVDGADTVSSGFSETNVTTPATIGGRPDGGVNANYFDGYISEIIIYDRYLKQSEVEAVENYLSKKYKINVDN